MKKIRILVFGIIICVIVGIGIYFVAKWTSNQPQEDAVVQQIRALNRWETSSYTVQQVIDSGTSGNVFQQFLFGNRILLVAQGTVVAGFDLTAVSKNDIHIDGETISLQMPTPIILSTSLDESQTKVYDREKGLLVLENNNLESQARASAVNKIEQAACSEGILNSASDNAKKQLTSMLQTIGFKTISISIPQGHC